MAFLCVPSVLALAWVFTPKETKISVYSQKKKIFLSLHPLCERIGNSPPAAKVPWTIAWQAARCPQEGMEPSWLLVTSSSWQVLFTYCRCKYSLIFCEDLCGKVFECFLLHFERFGLESLAKLVQKSCGFR